MIFLTQEGGVGVDSSLSLGTNSPLSLLNCRPPIKMSSSPIRGEQCL